MPQQSMPNNVARFERIAYSALALSTSLSLLDWRTLIQSLPGNGTWIWLASFTLSWAVQPWGIWLIARRRKNWARWTGVVMLVMALPGYIYFLAGKLQDTPILGAACLIGPILWYVSFCFLFTGDAPAWFRQQSVTPIAPEPRRQ